MKDMDLLLEAKTARKNAYSPYSKISVGAALLTDDGKVYRGANIENASYGATICAERSALVSAISNGERKFSAIAIVGGKSGEDEIDSFYPCGICRQCLSEFCDGDFKIITEDNGEARVQTLSALLPQAFSKELL